MLCHEPSEEPRGGLGLLIVRRMLVLHGGDIRLTDSTTGACFRFSSIITSGGIFWGGYVYLPL